MNPYVPDCIYSFLLKFMRIENTNEKILKLTFKLNLSLVIEHNKSKHYSQRKISSQIH